MTISPIQAAYVVYENRDTIKRILLWFILTIGGCLFFLYLVIATAFAVIQGRGGVTDGVLPQVVPFTEFQSFSYKTIDGEIWYTFTHPYIFPTLGVLTQGVMDSGAKVGNRHIAWDIADLPSRQTEVKAFADGKVVEVKNNMLYNTTRRWEFCDTNINGICWYEVSDPADIQIGCGNEIFIQHADGLESQYCHLASVSVKVGDQVMMGEVIGYQGSTGWATGKHLHFALWRGGKPIDPSYAFSQTSLSNWGD